ncbi:hypothetical protein NBG4_120054 [Candidatus Sulfobium mesophilum]|uniref:Uncharacterized protein n=1 Tax=Candidatus Sulfobium mesophilum TaxID=2016548 RepID=A0A2U3QEJ9_9BACT|nr:hypothetical protein NBG4_120054 [Candidatus Sulfobium mesophilum]
MELPFDSEGEEVDVKRIKSTQIVCLAAFLLVASLVVSCTSGMRLNTQEARYSEDAGTYRVILFGCNFNNDLETIAFLDKRGDKYDFEPYAADFKFKIKGVPAKEALKVAEEFVNCNTSFLQVQTYGIIGPNGEILGYEVRPLYEPLAYGDQDVLLTDYWLKDDKVVIKIRLKPSVERMLQRGGGDKDRGR